MIKRPLVWVLSAYLAGMYLAWHRLSIVIVIIGMPFVALAAYLFMFRIKNKWMNRKDSFLWCMPFLLLLGFCTMKGQLQSPELDDQFEQEITCELTGNITMIVKKQWGRALYVHNNKIILNEGDPPYLCENVIVFITNDQNYLVGNQITVHGTLQKFSEAANPGQFNEKRYYQIENIDYKLEAKRIQVTDAGYSRYHVLLGSIKNKLLQVYTGLLSEREAGTLIAMLLGEKYLLEDEIKQLYQVNGISHLLAISGLHVSMLGMFVFGLLKRLKIPITLATFFSIFFIYSYGILTNFSVSTNRAVVMMAVLLLAGLAGKTYDMLSAMALSALILLLQDPSQILSAGFLLSFGAVVGIAVLYPCLKQLFHSDKPMINAFINSLLISISAQLSTAPFVLYFFYQLPVYSVITNIIILPFVTILTLTSILAGIAGIICLPIGVFLIGGADYILKLYEGICLLGSNLPGNIITVGQPDQLRLLLYAMLLVLFVWCTTKYNKKFGVFIPFAASLLILIPHSNVGFEVTFLDVGQGDAIYMESDAGSSYLIDGGSTDIKNVGKYRLQPFLLSKGVDVLDYAFITHSDYDHVSGLLELIAGDKIKLKQILLPYLAEKDDAYINIEESAKAKGIKLQYIKAGDRIQAGELQILCLHPTADYIAASTNAYSSVLSVTYGSFDLLLTGDLQQDGEELITELLKKSTDWKGGKMPVSEYDILKVAHHGSKYSTSEAFLEVIEPDISLISCGKDNLYGHPHQETLDRLEEIGSKIYITYESGALTVKTDGEKMEIAAFINHK